MLENTHSAATCRLNFVLLLLDEEFFSFFGGGGGRVGDKTNKNTTNTYLAI